MRTSYQSVASHGVIRPWFAERVYFILLFAHFVLVHVIKRISNEFSFHTMYYETRCVFYIPSPEARGYKTHNSFHNTSYGMKIHLRSYIYVIVIVHLYTTQFMHLTYFKTRNLCETQKCTDRKFWSNPMVIWYIKWSVSYIFTMEHTPSSSRRH